MGLNTDWIFGAENLLLLAFLVFLEIALSIDNFAGMRETLDGLPEARKKAIRSAASISGLVLRVAVICVFMELTILLDPFARGFFSAIGISTGKALFLTLGGTFLIFKAAGELRTHLAAEAKPPRQLAHTNAFSIWLQLACVDLFLSLDSVIAALSMVNSVKLIIVAMIIAHLTLHLNWERIDRFFAQRSSMMTLTLAFVLLLGIVSVFRGLGAALAEETLLAALMFGVLLEGLNLKDKHARVQQETERKRNRKTSNRTKNTDWQNAATISNSNVNNARIADLANSHAELATTFGALVPGPSSGQSRSPAQSRSTEQSLDLFHEELCCSCQTRTHSIFPFCLTCGQARTVAEEVATAT
jgi:Membrane protein TerC, possibly involved in tellurium resistance